jgi:hypothetical protein
LEVFGSPALASVRVALPVVEAGPASENLHISSREQMQQRRVRNSITSSARASSVGGTVRPSTLAVWWLMTSSNLLDCTTGKSTGLAPLRMRPV